MTFSWTSDSRDVTGRSTPTGNTSILTINKARRRDDGSYVCTVRSGSLSVGSNTTTLTVYGMCYLRIIQLIQQVNVSQYNTLNSSLRYYIERLANRISIICQGPLTKNLQY